MDFQPFRLFTPAYGKDRRPFFLLPTVDGKKIKIYDLTDPNIEYERQRWKQIGTPEDSLEMMGFVPRNSKTCGIELKS